MDSDSLYIRALSWIRRCCYCGRAIGWLLLISASAPTAATRSEWGALIWQNDLLAGKDGGGYSNGTFGTLYQFDDSAQALNALAPLVTRTFLPIMPDSAELAIVAQTLGQTMATPRDISLARPDPNDISYGGLLFWRSALTAVKDKQADTLGVTVGLVGPWSGAEHTQKFVHKLVGAQEPKGWGYQLNNELVFQISRTRAWRFRFDDCGTCFERDVIVALNAHLGTLASGLGCGVLFRVGSGLHNSLVSSSLLDAPYFAPANIGPGWNVHVGFGVSALLNHILINGNTFSDSASIPLQVQQSGVVAGFSYTWSHFSLQLTAEDAGALATPYSSRQRFGSVTLSWRIN